MDDLYTLLGRADPERFVLDLGCGRGSFHYESCRARVIAMDLTLPDTSLQQRPQTFCLLADSGAIPLHDASVDVVVSHHTLEHFENYKITLSEIRRILKPDGWLWIAVPNGYGFDDALYRFLFAGGGHVNRFRHDYLVAEVEEATGTRLIRECDLFSSFIYLRKPAEEELQHFPARAGFLGEIPDGFRTFGVLTLNGVTRLLDKFRGSRLSQYGWGFVFARTSMTVDTMPSYFNVCRQCGSGNSAEAVRPTTRTVLGIGFYKCVHCREWNIFVAPPRDLQ